MLLIGATEHGADVMLPGLTDALGERLPDWRLRFRLDRNVTLADAIEHGARRPGRACSTDPGCDPAERVGNGCAEMDFGTQLRRRRPSEPLPVVMFSEPCTLREPTFAALDRIGVRLPDRRREFRPVRACRPRCGPVSASRCCR